MTEVQAIGNGKILLFPFTHNFNVASQARDRRTVKPVWNDRRYKKIYFL